VRPGRAPEADPLGPLAGLAPAAQLAATERRLRGGGGGPLGHLLPASELDAPWAAPAPGTLDGRLLEAVCARALGGRQGAVFTPGPEARLLAAFGLTHAAARRSLAGGGPDAGGAERLSTTDLLSRLLAGRPDPAAARALDGLTVLDPACGGGALLAAAERLARAVGARLVLHGLDVAPLAVRAASTRLALLGADAHVRRADALEARWPRCDLLLANPPFLRHEAIPPAQKARAAAASGLSRQADLSAHLAALALRRAPVAALVLPRALFTSRSAAPVLADAAARGGFALRLRSRAAGSFAASVDTLLATWVEGAADLPPAEAGVPLSALGDGALLALAGTGGVPPRPRRSSPARATSDRGERHASRRGAEPGAALRLDEVCDVRFGLKTGCNAFFHLWPLGAGRYRSALAGEVALAGADVAPLLAGLKEARAPERVEPSRVLFRPAGPLSAAARAYVAAGEAALVHLRPTCAARTPWWSVGAGRSPAPVLYPAKVGARAFAVLNTGALLEDKKWHALFPRGLPAWQLALVLSATPVRLAIDEGARQLTGAQAIADVDCRVLAAAPVPRPEALARLAGPLAEVRAALATDEVTTALARMLARPAQRELDLLVGRALGLSAAAVARARSALQARVESRLEHAAAVRGQLPRG